MQVDYLCLTRLEVAQREIDEAREWAPVLVHMLGRAGQPAERWESFDWSGLNAVIARAGAPHTAIHLDIRAEDWPREVELSVQKRHESEAMIARLRGTFASASAHLDCPVLFENVPYYGFHGALRVAVDPAVMWQLASDGVGMLLDVAHLRCTACHLGVDTRSLASSLPLSTVRELHVSGPETTEDDGLHDSHGILSSEDYDLIDWCLGRTDPEVLTLEYGGTDPEFDMDEGGMGESLVSQLTSLRKMIG